MNIEIRDVLAILPDDDGFKTETTSIYIKGSEIAGVGNKPDDFTAEKVISGENKLALPGLINCHTHAYMSIFRNLADDLSFENWLFKSVMPLEDQMTGEDAYWGALLGYTEMLKTGTTSFVDMHMFKGDCPRAINDIGIRGVLTRGLVGFGKNDESGLRRIDELKYEIDNFGSHPRMSFMVAPHAIYTTDREYLELCAETAKKLGVSVHIHVSETKNEVETAYEKYGMSPVKYIAETGLFDSNTIAAHCVHLSEEDIMILADKKVNVAANPKSNLKLANGFAPIPALLVSGVNVCLGTDGAASNNSLNMFSDMNYNSLIHKGITANPEIVSAATTFQMATINGALATGINTGSIEVGKKADISLLDLNNPQFTPRHNLLAALVYSANGSEVDTVIIDGEIVLQDKKLTKIDENEIYRKANETLINLKKKI